MKTQWLADDGETWLIDPDDILTDTARARMAPLPARVAEGRLR
jgi:hypothetical protein